MDGATTGGGDSSSGLGDTAGSRTGRFICHSLPVCSRLPSCFWGCSHIPTSPRPHVPTSPRPHGISPWPLSRLRGSVPPSPRSAVRPLSPHLLQLAAAALGLLLVAEIEAGGGGKGGGGTTEPCWGRSPHAPTAAPPGPHLDAELSSPPTSSSSSPPLSSSFSSSCARSRAAILGGNRRPPPRPRTTRRMLSSNCLP